MTTPIISVDSKRHEANVRTVIQLYKDVLSTNEPHSSKLVKELLRAFTFALKEVARLERDSAKAARDQAQITLPLDKK